MQMIDIIEHKRDGAILSFEEISFFIKGYVAKRIPDYQVSALLMAIYLNGLNEEETFNLTKAMLYSGEIVDLSGIKGIKADKHSTGGVGDKVSLVLAPILAAFNIKLAKMSGRGLGHTGGTLDKLEAIPGFDVNLTKEEFINEVNTINLSVIGQTANLVPADKLLYALRDVTATVSSIPLIASSIMSKKLASGADIIVLDVKVGSGAFMKSVDEALVLANTMVKIGRMFNKKTVAILTNMNEPLGYAVGNSLEVIEAIDTLNGKGPKDLLEICLKIASTILLEAKLYDTEKEANEAILKKINNHEALEKFKQMVSYQKGDISYIEDVNHFPKAKIVRKIVSKQEGYISLIDALGIGHASMFVGAGRKTKNDLINPNVGVVLNKKVGDYVKENEVLAYLHMDEENMDAFNLIFDSFIIDKTYNKNPLIIGKVGE